MKKILILIVASLFTLSCGNTREVKWRGKWIDRNNFTHSEIYIFDADSAFKVGDTISNSGSGKVILLEKLK